MKNTFVYMGSISAITMYSCAILGSGCGAEVGTTDGVQASAFAGPNPSTPPSRSVPRGGGDEAEEWARCWTAPHAAPLDTTHVDLLCTTPARTATPALADVTAVAGGSAAKLEAAPKTVATVRADAAKSVELSFTTLGGGRPEGLGLSTTLKRTVDLASATSDRPVILRSPFAVWRVTLESSLPGFVATPAPYDVAAPGFTWTTTGPLRASPGSLVSTGRPETTTLLVPPGGSIVLRIDTLDGARFDGTIAAAGTYQIGGGTLTAKVSDAGAPVDAGAPEDASPTEDADAAASCGGDGQKCCSTANGCTCAPFHTRSIFGDCQACGDEGKKACLGGTCRAGLTADALRICRR
ncbi:MAG: hypothetical protein U0169_26835 [Polyangiaceae bacterium]